MKKVLLDQFVLQAPYTSGVLILNGLLNGVLLNDSLKMIKGSLLEILMTGWPYWILVQSIGLRGEDTPPFLEKKTN